MVIAAAKENPIEDLNIPDRPGQAPVHEDMLVHLVYETALDNSLWPEMIVRIMDQIDQLERTPENPQVQARIDRINTHFKRAYAISEKMLALQERDAGKAQVLAGLAFEVALFDRSGGPIFESKAAPTDPPGQLALTKGQPPPLQLPAGFSQKCTAGQQSGEMQIWAENDAAGTVYVLLPKELALAYRFPARAETVLLSYRIEDTAAVDHFARRHRLSPAHGRFLKAFVTEPDLRTAATSLGLTYETARRYLKTIFAETGIRSQAALIRALWNDPSALLPASVLAAKNTLPVRRLMTLPDGRQLEYFSLGPEDGYPVFFMDALAGNSIDTLGHPERYRRHLTDLGLRLITPCRPGGFRSSYRALSSLRDYAADIAALCAHLKLQKISLLSYSYGSNAALGIAHELPDLVERLTMSSVSYTAYAAQNLRDMDMFFQITNVVGRRWPNLLNLLIPFLARSVVQNVDTFANRMLSRAVCDHERAILQSPLVRERAAAMVAERTAGGMEGVIEEFRINAQPYDFNVADIAVPMTLFHGDCDVNNPLAGAELLARHAPNATLHVLRGMGHHHLFVEWDWILAAAMGRNVTIPGTA
jgi:pimeloyl-ACP methyl ester carboxylesterase